MKPSSSAILTHEMIYSDYIDMDLQVHSHSCYRYNLQVAVTAPELCKNMYHEEKFAATAGRI